MHVHRTVLVPKISDDVGFSFYRYDPSMGAAVLSVLLFIGTTGYNIMQMFKSRTWFLWDAYVYYRIHRTCASSKQSPNWTLGPYLVQTLFLFLAPALLAAPTYMFLGRIILVLQAESHALMKKKWLTKVFVTGGVLSFLLQGAGGGIQSNGSLGSMKTGEHIIIGGLVIQILFFAFFIVTATHFDWKLKKYPIPHARSPDIPWQKHLNVLYMTSCLIMILYLYIFDLLLMFLTMVTSNAVHPQEIGQPLRRPTRYEMTDEQV
ncbi:RTA1 like protein-domain-containing protein [Aspergillus foveolatus]|uniref:RTA1 like protein-domain-containing protein n=1 Tax=Aspergillus foveolatus TaxID=210207 RepID=UPI003CCE1BCA